MPKETILKPYASQQCIKSCETQKNIQNMVNYTSALNPKTFANIDKSNQQFQQCKNNCNFYKSK